ncbi:PEP/pyruvate-binding domain-containing protein [Lentzea guizhouensis]|uniref:PEP/pyruvate-binding domain-containing protein n=1 Tax=Lentzea guizhouensis TaxID=1586287 RepID=UPI000AD6D7B3|nr:PEP/pyruvate-binding domain-containing protein [Lentzea guizhouensis]
MIPLILPLDDPRADLAAVGGKGASLAELVRAGLPVPPGFHLTTRAYRERSAQGLQEAYDDLGGPVAVRSSATAEDLPGLSFAGQHDTLLNVTGDGLLDAVRQCWDSLGNDRAVAYRERNGIAEAEMAVVVQRMVPADVSGVLFTADPVTGRAQPVINATRGLGEALVSGEADSADLLTDAQKAELTGLGQRIEALHGRSVDVEWALAGGRFWILQARPITAARVEWNDSLDGDYLWSNGNVGEAVPEVMTPVTWSLVRVLSNVRIGPHPISGNIGGRFYLNLSTYSAVGTAIGKAEQMLRSGEETFGRIPAGVTVPPLPMSRLAIVAAVLRGAGGPVKQQFLYRTRLPRLIRGNPARCAAAHRDRRLRHAGRVAEAVARRRRPAAARRLPGPRRRCADGREWPGGGAARARRAGRRGGRGHVAHRVPRRLRPREPGTTGGPREAAVGRDRPRHLRADVGTPLRRGVRDLRTAPGGGPGVGHPAARGAGRPGRAAGPSGQGP